MLFDTSVPPFFRNSCKTVILQSKVSNILRKLNACYEFLFDLQSKSLNVPQQRVIQSRKTSRSA